MNTGKTSVADSLNEEHGIYTNFFENEVHSDIMGLGPCSLARSFKGIIGVYDSDCNFAADKTLTATAICRGNFKS